MPLIGLLSDSHGRGKRTHRAVKLLRRHGAEMLVHLGDVETESVIDALVAPIKSSKKSRSKQEAGGGGPGKTKAGGVIPVHLVFGNTDHDVLTLTRYAQSFGMAVDHPLGELRWGSRRLVFTHGDHVELMDQAIQDGATYLCHGHTHVADDRRVGKTRIINPGALYRARRYTVALLDTDQDTVQFFEVE